MVGTPVTIQNTEVSMAEMHASIINNFRQFFEPEGLVHFDMAAKNMEIAGYKHEVSRLQQQVAKLEEPKSADDDQAEVKPPKDD